MMLAVCCKIVFQNLSVEVHQVCCTETHTAVLT